MRKVCLSLGVTLSLAVLVVSSASAQTRSPWSIQGSGLFAGLGGSAYSGLNAGPGLEVQIRHKLGDVWSLGCGYQMTDHNLSRFSGSTTLQGAFCEPRRVIDIGSDRIFPYIAARAGLLQQKLSSGTVSSTATGTMLNGGAGVMIPFGNAASDYPTLIELGASLGFANFGNFSQQNSATNAVSTGTTGSGWNYVLRAGLAIGLPFGTQRAPSPDRVAR
ncbi:MAG TPA: hypothetical protein VN706_17160 [Gemmatimonadaceae bacterium]|nr:hypothetical protein [Gemmatimonadaceae bacterium]